MHRSPFPAKRIANIIEYLTYSTYCYVSRGLFQRHKQMFLLLLAIKVGISNNEISLSEFNMFLKVCSLSQSIKSNIVVTKRQGGTSLTAGEGKQQKKKATDWLNEKAWANITALADVKVLLYTAHSTPHTTPRWSLANTQ